MPGPGNYNESNEFGKDGKAVRIYGKSKERRDDGLPGPGHYEEHSNNVK